MKQLQEINSDKTLLSAAARLPVFDDAMERQARSKLDQLTKPQGSLGRLEDIAAWMCGWQRTLTPRAEKAYTLVFAGNHGVVAQGVSAYPASVTEQMVANFSNGGAAINQLCKAIPSTLRVTPLSLDRPTADFTLAPAMSADECAEAFAAGMQAVPEDADIIMLGEMGIGNTTAAAALAHAVAGGAAADWVGAGTGVDVKGMVRKREAIAKAIALHRDAMRGPMSVLQHVGGRELAALAGAAWRARELRIPVILDGYVVAGALSPLKLADKNALNHCIAGHVSAEPGHRRLLAWLDMPPLLDLNMRLGEGSGAQLALSLVRASLAAFNHMATFESASVATKHA